MSTEVRRAVVHYANPATGSVRVKIPGFTGDRAVPVHPDGLTYSDGVWSTPSAGDIVMVAVEDNADVYWVSGYPNGLSTAEVNALVDAGVTAGTAGLASTAYVDYLASPTTWTDANLQNSWVNYASGYQALQYRKVGDTVQVRGAVKDGSLNAVIFTLPTGYRPPASLTIPVWTIANILGALNVSSTTGEVSIGSNGGTGYVQILFQFSVTS